MPAPRLLRGSVYTSGPGYGFITGRDGLEYFFLTRRKAIPILGSDSSIEFQPAISAPPPQRETAVVFVAAPIETGKHTEVLFWALALEYDSLKSQLRRAP